jgi:hypothetical protein
MALEREKRSYLLRVYPLYSQEKLQGFCINPIGTRKEQVKKYFFQNAAEYGLQDYLSGNS